MTLRDMAERLDAGIAPRGWRPPGYQMGTPECQRIAALLRAAADAADALDRIQCGTHRTYLSIGEGDKCCDSCPVCIASAALAALRAAEGER